jgi:hypothetical protein
VGWRPSLVVLPAVGLVAARAIKLLTTIKVCACGVRNRALS